MNKDNIFLGNVMIVTSSNYIPIDWGVGKYNFSVKGIKHQALLYKTEDGLFIDLEDKEKIPMHEGTDKLGAIKEGIRYVEQGSPNSFNTFIQFYNALNNTRIKPEGNISKRRAKKIRGQYFN